MAEEKPHVEAKMNTITAQGSAPGEWSGMPIALAKPIYTKLYDLGVLSLAHFGVELQPFFDDAEIGDASIFEDDILLPWLANSVDLSILDAQTDSAHIGHYQINYITGNNSGEITINFIETKNGDLLKSARRIKEVMFSPDGTQGLPKDYLMKMVVYCYDRHNRDNRVIEVEHIVMLQAASIPLSADSKNGVAMVPLTFTKTMAMLL